MKINLRRICENLLPLICFFFLSLFIFRVSLFSEGFIISPETCTQRLPNFVETRIGNGYVWSSLLGKSVRGLKILSYHLPFVLIAESFHMSLTGMIIIENIVVTALSGASMYYFASYLIKKHYGLTNSRKVAISSFLAGLAYLINPSFVIGDAFRISVRFAYAIFPLIIALFIVALYEKSYKHAILSATLYVAGSMYAQQWIIGVGILLVGYTIYSVFFDLLNRNLDIEVLSHHSKTLFMVLGLYFAFSGYFLISTTSAKTVASTTLLTKPAVDVTWSNANLWIILQGSSHFQLPEHFSPIPIILQPYQSLIMALGFITPILAFSALLFERRNRDVIFFSSLAIITVLLFVGLGHLSKAFRYWVVIEAPLSHFVGRVFRTTRIPDQFISLSYGVLIAFTLVNIFSRIKSSQFRVGKYPNFPVRSFTVTLISVILVSSFLLSAWPLATGDINGQFKPVRIPQEYYGVNSWLESLGGDFKVLWTPEFWGPFQPYWKESGVGGADGFPVYGSGKPTYFSRNNLMTHYYAHTVAFRYNSLLMRGDTESLGSLLAPLGIKYLILHDDVAQFENKMATALETLNQSEVFELVKHDGIIYVFENRLYSSRFSSASNNFFVAGGLETANFFESLNNNYTSHLILLDQEKFNEKNLLRIPANLVLTNYKSKMDLIIHFLDDKYIIAPSQYTIDYDIQKWSKALITDPHHGLWHTFINRFEDQKWEFSYDIVYGFVFTVGRDALRIPLTIEKSGDYELYIRYLRNIEGGEIRIWLDHTIIEDVDSLDCKNEFVWEKIATMSLSEGKHTLQLENSEGTNAINLLVLIPEEDMEQYEDQIDEINNNKRIMYIMEVDSDLHTVENDVRSFLYIVKNGNYSLAIKPCDGKVEGLCAEIGGKVYGIYTSEMNNHWYYTHNIHLDGGKQEIYLYFVQSNLVKNPSFEDWNASSNNPLYWTKPKETFSQSLDSTTKIQGNYSYRLTTNITSRDWSWVKSEDIPVIPEETYVFKTYAKWENTNSSHIAINAYNSSSDSWYRFTNLPYGVHGTSNWTEFRIERKIPSNITKIGFVLNAGWVNDPTKRNSTLWIDGIEVHKKPSKIEEIVLYTSQDEEILEDIFKLKELPAEIISYRKINPTKYIVEAKATTPFMLSFAEAYDPLWIAQVNGKRIESIPLYSVINGFWINQTGQLEITIEYEPQKWFYYGSIISATTLLACLIYLTYNWAKNKAVWKRTKKFMARVRLILHHNQRKKNIQSRKVQIKTHVSLAIVERLLEP